MFAVDVTRIVLAGSVVAALMIALVSAVFTVRNGRTLNEMASKVTAIDRAVNGQPEGEKTMVDKVTGIATEQGRVAEELRDSLDPPAD